MRLTLAHWTMGLLASASIALASAIFVRMTSAPVAQVSEIRAEHTQPQPSDLHIAAFTFPSSSAFEIITARPLFSPSRRPFVPAPATTGAISQPSEQEVAPPVEASLPFEFELVGIVQIANRRVALLKSAEGEIKRVQIGASLDGWEVNEITASQLVVRLGEQKKILILKYDRREPS
ncbi:hypothetical protein [Rhodoligotrophos defluvii]|uniref:hypothetical protein n=1 Tax=Rhodoligotrophos defluvii TaxID=2561934 RepID=UPI0010CA0B39|nr:hypothetical protein [Rhodoligotrophos defluvii]